MALSIKNPEADRLAREIAAATGESLTQAVVGSLRLRLQTVPRRGPDSALLTELNRIAKHCASLRKDFRTPDEIIGYDEKGLPR
jgi:antitoxin VapB